MERPQDVGVAELDRLDREAREEDLEPIDRAEMLDLWRRQGWPGELPELHTWLLRYEAFADDLGEEYVASAHGPALRWPAGWGTWSLARHRRAIRLHRHELGARDKVEEWYRSLAGMS